MAVDDVSFYTLLGEEITRSGLLEQMIGFYSLLLEAGETKVTDFNEGSEIRNLLEAFAVLGYIVMENKNELTSIGFVDSAEGEFLDRHGANPFINLPRDEGMEATGFVTFTVPVALSSETVIPEGTIVVNSETGLDYATVNDTVLDTSSTSVTVAVECLTTGEDGNCGVGEIDTIDEIISDIPELTVTNENPLTGGTDYEEDDEYRERLLEYKRQDDFGSLPYYMRLSDGIDGVHDILLVDDEDFTKKILVNGYIKPTPDTVLAEVLEVYSETNNHVINHTFTVDKPIPITVNLEVTLNVTSEIDSDLVKTLIKDFFDGTSNMPIAGYEYDGLYMGEDLTGDMLTSNLVLLEGVESASVTMTVNDTATDPISVNEDEVATWGSISVTQNVVN